MAKPNVKGALFERMVAKKIHAAAGPQYKKEKCFRTPRSGGHHAQGYGDVQVSKRLRRVFPFVVECKHWKDWSVDKLFKDGAQLANFLAQASEGAVRAKKRYNLTLFPLLVVRGNNTPILCVFPKALLERDGNSKWSGFKAPLPRVMLHGWVACLFDSFLQRWYKFSCGQ